MILGTLAVGPLAHVMASVRTVMTPAELGQFGAALDNLARDAQFKRNLNSAAAFIEGVIDHPETLDAIPDGAHIVPIDELWVSKSGTVSEALSGFGPPSGWATQAPNALLFAPSGPARYVCCNSPIFRTEAEADAFIARMAQAITDGKYGT